MENAPQPSKSDKPESLPKPPDNTPKEIFLRDYQPPEYLVPEVALHFDIQDTETIVSSKLTIERNSNTSPDAPLVLDGRDLTARSVLLNGKPLTDEEYQIDQGHLTIWEVPEDKFTLEVETSVRPEENKANMGLYASNGTFVTQMEPLGFRRVTFFPDRPDVMSTYTVTVEGSEKELPVLLSNGEIAAQETLANGRHSVTYHDPFPKPSYLFALVAGDLGILEDTYVTKSGREVKLEIYAEHGLQDRSRIAMQALKEVMELDENHFGLEYDLDTFRVVAVNDFNAGAMENKGLNIFNSHLLLADPETATDEEILRVKAVVAHEYQHNWTGNRVTCRDWFQLGLKEGATVFRDQEFTAETYSKAVKRIEDVQRLRERQFPEDSGPNAHPVRPESFVSINNFYTATVYEKGAEVIRMLQTLIGQDKFLEGLRKYLVDNDGTAATVEDLISAMSEVGGRDLSQFMRWYSQAGTPVLHVEGTYDPNSRTYRLLVEQEIPVTEYDQGKDPKGPYHIPLVMGLLDSSGNEIPLKLEGDSSTSTDTTKVLELTELKQEFVFRDVDSPPTPSLLRNFSAPVILKYPYTDEELTFLLAHDTDSFNRSEAAQRLSRKEVELAIEEVQRGEPAMVSRNFHQAIATLLEDTSLDPAFVAMTLKPPAIDSFAQEMDQVDYQAIADGRLSFLKQVAAAQEELLLKTYHRLKDELEDTTSIDSESIGKRALKNVCLRYLGYRESPEIISIAKDQFDNAKNMTDSYEALSVLCRIPSDERNAAVQAFYDRWRVDPVVIDKWFSVQITRSREETLELINRLVQLPEFDEKNPNKIRSVHGAFTTNHVEFHHASGNGYQYLADKIIEIDQFNSDMAAMLAKKFGRYPKLDQDRQQLIRKELERILASDPSREVHEIVSKTLRSGPAGD